MNNTSKANESISLSNVECTQDIDCGEKRRCGDGTTYYLRICNNNTCKSADFALAYPCGNLQNQIDHTCNVDSDCTLAVPSIQAECYPCDPLGCHHYYANESLVEAVNKIWEPYCPNKKAEMCISCIGGISADNIPYCINNKCNKFNVST